MSLREKILTALEENRGRDLSGQSLAQAFCVSRNAIWKSIQALREEGYPILAGTNRGYRLSDHEDRLFAAGIKRLLPAAYAHIPFFVYPSLDSTNAQARRLLEQEIPAPFFVLSDEQTAGRGRFGRAFFSPAGSGLYMTAVLCPALDFASAVLLTTAAAVAVVESVSALSGLNPMIKWVNDLFLNGKKFGGILTEATGNFESGQIDSAIIGFGINVHPCPFPEDLNAVACSLGGANLSRKQLAASILARFLSLVEKFPDRSFLETYRKHSLVIGKEIEFAQNGRVRRARATDIDDTGALVIKTPGGKTETLRAGEISLHGLA